MDLWIDQNHITWHPSVKSARHHGLDFVVNPELRDDVLECTIRRFGHHLNGTFRFFKNQDGMDIKIMFRKDLPSGTSSTLKEDNFQKTTLFRPDVHKFLFNKIPAVVG